MKCDCVQCPPLRQTGWSGDHPEWYCPVCKKEFYGTDSHLTEDRPFKWPEKKRV